MAPHHIRKSERGSTLLEALAVTGVLAAFVGGLLLAGYLIFARAWVTYQSEQTLYCLLKSGNAPECRARLQKKLAGFLPMGRVTRLNTVEARGGWRLEMEWKWSEYQVHVNKELSVRIAGKKKVSR